MGNQIKEALENWRESNPNPEAAAPPEAVRERLKTVYGSSYSDEIDGRSDDQVLEMASLLTNGVPMATPVFDGVREADVAKLLELAGLDRSGQVDPFDGRPGDRFDRQETAGYLYMLMEPDLVGARLPPCAIGHYPYVHQEPLGGT